MNTPIEKIVTYTNWNGKLISLSKLRNELNTGCANGPVALSTLQAARDLIESLLDKTFGDVDGETRPAIVTLTTYRTL